MPSFVSCLSSANLSRPDKKKLQEIRQEYIEKGIDPTSAEFLAIEEMMNDAVNEHNKVAKKANKELGEEVQKLEEKYQLPEDLDRYINRKPMSKLVEEEDEKMAAYREQKEKEKKRKAVQAEIESRKPKAGEVAGTKVKVKRKRQIVKPTVEEQIADELNPSLLSDHLSQPGVDVEVLEARNSDLVRELFGSDEVISPGYYTITDPSPEMVEEALDNGWEKGILYDEFNQHIIVKYNRNESHLSTAQDVVNALKKILHKDDWYRVLIQKIEAANIGLDQIAVQWDPALSTSTSGYYQPRKETGISYDEMGVPTDFKVKGHRLIALNEMFADDTALGQRDPSMLLKTFLHELTHAATRHAVHEDNKVAMELDDLRKHVIKVLHERTGGLMPDRLKKDWYGLTDVHEFLAEGFTNPKFQQMLSEITVEANDKANPITNLWKQFIDAVRNALGIEQDISDTALSRLLEQGEQLMVNKEEIDADIEVGRSNDWLGEFRYDVENNKNYSREQEQINYSIDNENRGAATLTSALSNNAGYVDAAKQQLRNGTDTGTNLLLGFLTGDTIESEFGKDFEGKMKVTDAKGTRWTNPLREYFRSKQAEQAEAKKFERAAEPLHNKWRKAEKKHAEHMEAFNNLMYEATMYQVHPDKAWTDAANDITRNNNRAKKAGEVAHKRLQQQWKALPSELRTLYKEVSNFYKQTSEQMRTTAILNLADMYELDNPSLRRLMTKPTATLESLLELRPPVGNWENIASAIAKINENMTQNGPYFPLNRFGDFVVAYEATEERGGFSSKEAAYEDAQKVRGAEPGTKTSPPVKMGNGWGYVATQPGWSLFESRSEAEEFRASLNTQGVKTGNVTMRLEFEAPDYSAAGQLMSMAERKLSKRAGGAQSVAAMREALVHMLPETSIRKRFLIRKNIAGANKNHRRAFAAYTQSAGWHLAGMKHRRSVDNSFNALVDVGKGKVDSNVTMRMSQVVNEMIKRHQQGKVEQTKIGRGLAKFGFINFLMSASYSMINATQPYTMTLPHLGGIYGMRPAMRQMGKAYSLVAGEIGRAIVEARGGASVFTGKGEFDLNEATNQVIRAVEAKDPAAAKMLRTLADQGIIDATFTLEISEAAMSDKPGIVDKVVEAGRVMPFAVEIMNRSTTAIAAYNLALNAARKKGMPPARADAYATEQARFAVIKTQFDYTELNRPRHFVRNDIMRAITMFKIHPLGVYSFMAHNMRKALGKDATRASRVEAAKTMGIMLMTHGSLAGAAGSLLMEPIRLALAGLATIFDIEDDDEWLGWMANPEIAMREFLYEASGSKEFSEVVTHGLPRAVGIDVSTRIGLQNLMIQWGSGEHAVRDSVVNSILGPLFGSADSFTRGYDYIKNGGDLLRGLEYFMPKAVRDLTRTYRYATTGMTDWNGDMIQDPEAFSGAELFGRALGFGTSTESETYMGRKYIQNLKVKMQRQRKAFMNQYANAGSRREQREVWKEIQEWNKNLPKDIRRQYKLNRADLVRSMRQRRKKERETDQGVRLTRQERRMRERIEFLNP